MFGMGGISDIMGKKKKPSPPVPRLIIKLAKYRSDETQDIVIDMDTKLAKDLMMPYPQNVIKMAGFLSDTKGHLPFPKVPVPKNEEQARAMAGGATNAFQSIAGLFGLDDLDSIPPNAKLALADILKSSAMSDLDSIY